jgi:peptide-methionine (S)-S-oxide reductase
MAEGSVGRATFGGGCFWCTEAIFRQLRGVIKVVSGYAGGTTPNPTYEQVCDHTTGHVEVVRIEYDPRIISYEQLVEVFFLTHDPTQINRQGNDVGEQYRSVIFYLDAVQRQTAEAVKERIETEGVFSDRIATVIVPFKKFCPAESFHQDYFAKNPEQPYCQAVINPKLAKFRKKFAALLKT